ncbi:hypothetical protein [Mesorhizobium sp.]|uniref:hypothetical protein n=1 Tax=Mesorhizobium sp. TaxID=1871066 RepID=UPI00121E2D57|nr:hypothetical protein [Mesorhizobium sp.]TIX25042.1 MAG: hypothetical protein E5V35_15980 [Mesorhizobium sp.]
MKNSHNYPAKGIDEMLVPRLTHVPLAERQAMRDGPRGQPASTRRSRLLSFGKARQGCKRT